MTTTERFKKFAADFAKLKGNREKVPLKTLQTRHRKTYDKLVGEVEEYAGWFTAEYIRTMAIPIHPKDKAGKDWLMKKVNAITEDERKPGGLYQQGRDALIDDLDQEKFRDRVWRIHDRLMREAYDPYQQRFNRWVGKPDNRWIYNSLFDAFWLEKPEYEDGGCWIDRDYNCRRMGYPPRIGADPQQQGAAG